MSVPATEPETLGHLSDEEKVDPNSKKIEAISGKSPMRIALARLRKDKIAVVCFIVVCFFTIVAVFAGPITSLFGVSTETVSPSKYLDMLGGGMPLKGPPEHGFDPEHPFGIAPKTAEDNLAHWIYGARTSLMIAFIATVVASLIGIVVGLLAGFMGGLVDKVLSFFTDAFLTVPFLLAALTMAPILNDRFALAENYQNIQRFSLVAILGLFGWMSVARLVRGEVLSLREREFIQAARVLGMPTRRILVKELLPNLAAPIIVAVSLMLPAFVALEAGLAFLGIGVTSGSSWGMTISKATVYFETYPLYLWEPLLGVVAVVLSLNLLGDAIRDALDPKTRR